MSEIELEIVTPNKIVAQEKNVTEIILPCSQGEVNILPGHTEFMSTLGQGQITYKIKGNSQSYQITGGLVAINNNKATILVDSLLATVTSLDDARKDKTERSK